MSKAERDASTAPVVPTIDGLTATAARLVDHANAIRNAARLDVADDLRLAARISTALANLRRGVADEAGRTHDPKSAERLRCLLIEEM